MSPNNFSWFFIFEADFFVEDFDRWYSLRPLRPGAVGCLGDLSNPEVLQLLLAIDWFSIHRNSTLASLRWCTVIFCLLKNFWAVLGWWRVWLKYVFLHYLSVIYLFIYLAATYVAGLLKCWCAFYLLKIVLLNLHSARPCSIHQSICSTDSFKRSLKAFLFQSAYGCETRVSWLLWCAIGLTVGGAIEITVVFVFCICIKCIPEVWL